MHESFTRLTHLLLKVKGRRALSPQGGAPPDSINDEEKDTAADTVSTLLLVISAHCLNWLGFTRCEGEFVL